MPDSQTPQESAHVDLDQPLPDAGKLKKLGLIVGVSAVVIAIVGISWRHHAVGGEQSVSRTASVDNVAVVHPVQVGGGDELVLPGQIQAWNNAAINARTSGYVHSWLADIGDHVHAGQALAVLDAPEVDQQLAQAEADYQTALANQHLSATTAKRWAQLLTQDAVAKQENDEKQGDLAAKTALSRASLANVKRLKATQGFERVLSPFDGVITSRSAQIGALVVTGNATAQPLFTVSDVHRMRIYVKVPQSYAAMIHPGIPATLEVPEYPNRAFPAVLVRSAGAVDVQSGSVLVELQADNTDRALKPGAYTQAHFHATGGDGSLSLPGSAILYGTAGPSVAVVPANGKGDANGEKVVTMRPVKIVRDDGNVVRVTGAISPNDTIVDSPPDAIHTGQKVRVTQVLKPSADLSAKPPATSGPGTTTGTGTNTQTAPTNSAQTNTAQTNLGQTGSSNAK
ncbi:efflux RND transporter periplasmic adaptor subunit [Novosphingobium sp.]|uniref:efflux RND transporter periplasmic adaptor subunit n=1 Tax=Novosphingobium sp. TaxID=1874826 RepID=UPI003D0FB6E3